MSTKPPQNPTPPNLPEGVYIISVEPTDDGKQIVTLICQNCGKTTTRTQRAGLLPKYCEDCSAIMKRQQTIESNKRKRAEAKVKGK